MQFLRSLFSHVRSQLSWSLGVALNETTNMMMDGSFRNLIECLGGKVRLPEILDQHEDTAGFVRLREKNRPAVGGNRDVVIYGPLNCQDFPDLAASEFVEAEVTVSHFVGRPEEVNPFLPDSPLAFAMHRVENFRFLISIH